MGANTIPIVKKSGKTVLGVKMGLLFAGQKEVPSSFLGGPGTQPSSHTAMLSSVAVEMRYLRAAIVNVSALKA